MGNNWPTGFTRAYRPDTSPQQMFGYQPNTRTGWSDYGAPRRDFVSGNTREGLAAWNRPPSRVTFIPDDRWPSQSAPTRVGSGFDYGKWLRRARFLGYALLAAEIAKQIQNALDPPEAFFPHVWTPPGWSVDCDIGFTGETLYGSNAFGPVCGYGSADAGTDWGDPPPVGLFGYPASGPALYAMGDNRWHWGLFSQGFRATQSPLIWALRIQWSYPGPPSAAPSTVPGVVLYPGDAVAPAPGDAPGASPAGEVERGPLFFPLPLSVPTVGHQAAHDAPGGAPGIPSVPVVPVPVPEPFPLGRVPHKFRGRPLAGERERKWAPSGPVAAVLRFVGLVTEAADFLEAAWWSLSKKSRGDAYRFYGHKPNFLERAAWTISHSGDVDPAALLQNMAQNAAGDAQGGRAGKHTAQWHQQNWKNFGHETRGRGPAETFKRLQGALKDSGLLGA